MSIMIMTVKYWNFFLHFVYFILEMHLHSYTGPDGIKKGGDHPIRDNLESGVEIHLNLIEWSQFGTIRDT